MFVKLESMSPYASSGQAKKVVYVDLQCQQLFCNIMLDLT